jgi:Restriction endonuclease
MEGNEKMQPDALDAVGMKALMACYGRTASVWTRSTFQAKRWEKPVGRPEIQKFFGALHGQRATKGVFVTTSAFSGEAIEHTGTFTPRVILIDGRGARETDDRISNRCHGRTTL